jgi:hypothetical protein
MKQTMSASCSMEPDSRRSDSMGRPAGFRPTGSTGKGRWRIGIINSVFEQTPEYRKGVIHIQGVPLYCEISPMQGIVRIRGHYASAEAVGAG